jgi:hypothetical protein
MSFTHGRTVLLEGSTNRLRDLLGEGGEIEVIAPDSDFAGIIQFEHPGHRNLCLLAERP